MSFYELSEDHGCTTSDEAWAAGQTSRQQDSAGATPIQFDAVPFNWGHRRGAKSKSSLERLTRATDHQLAVLAASPPKTGKYYWKNHEYAVRANMPVKLSMNGNDEWDDTTSRSDVEENNDHRATDFSGSLSSEYGRSIHTAQMISGENNQPQSVLIKPESGVVVAGLRDDANDCFVFNTEKKNGDFHKNSAVPKHAIATLAIAEIISGETMEESEPQASVLERQKPQSVHSNEKVFERLSLNRDSDCGHQPSSFGKHHSSSQPSYRPLPSQSPHNVDRLIGVCMVPTIDTSLHLRQSDSTSTIHTGLRSKPGQLHSKVLAQLKTSFSPVTESNANVNVSAASVKPGIKQSTSFPLLHASHIPAPRTILPVHNVSATAAALHHFELDEQIQSDLDQLLPVASIGATRECEIDRSITSPESVPFVMNSVCTSLSLAQAVEKPKTNATSGRIMSASAALVASVRNHRYGNPNTKKCPDIGPSADSVSDDDGNDHAETAHGDMDDNKDDLCNYSLSPLSSHVLGQHQESYKHQAQTLALIPAHSQYVPPVATPKSKSSASGPTSAQASSISITESSQLNPPAHGPVIAQRPLVAAATAAILENLNASTYRKLNGIKHIPRRDSSTGSLDANIQNPLDDNNDGSIDSSSYTYSSCTSSSSYTSSSSANTVSSSSRSADESGPHEDEEPVPMGIPRRLSIKINSREEAEEAAKNNVNKLISSFPQDPVPIVNPRLLPFLCHLPISTALSNVASDTLPPSLLAPPFNGQDTASVDFEHQNDDEVANIMAKIMLEDKGAARLGFALAERVHLINSINWLGSHVPCCVLDTLCAETVLLAACEKKNALRLEARLQRKEAREVDDKVEGFASSDFSDTVYYSDLSDDNQLHPYEKFGEFPLAAHLTPTPCFSKQSFKENVADCATSNTDYKKESIQSKKEWALPSCSTTPTKDSKQDLQVGNAIRTSKALAKQTLNLGKLNNLQRSQSLGSCKNKETCQPGKYRRASYSKESKLSVHSSKHNGPVFESKIYQPPTTRKSSLYVSLANHDNVISNKEANSEKLKESIPYTKPAFIDPFPFDSDDERQKLEREAKRGIVTSGTAEISAKHTIARNEAIDSTGNSTNRLSTPSERKTLQQQWNSTNASSNNLESKGSASKSNRSLLNRKQKSNELPKQPGHARRSHQLSRDMPMKLPYAAKHKCALLYVDIFGFTKLSTTLDVESLSKAINSYFQLIVNEIILHGGDILKFAGDALFAEWRASPSPLSTNEDKEIWKLSEKPLSSTRIEECVFVAAVCGAKIVSICSDYPVYANVDSGAGGRSQGPQVTALNVHCGLGFGEVAGVHVGDDETRREYLILGNPIDQVSAAEEMASLGELVASPEAMAALRETCDFSKEILSVPEGRPAIIAVRSQSYFAPKDKKKKRSESNNTIGYSHAVPTGLAQVCESMDTPALKQLQKLISLYVHPVVVRDEMATMSQQETRAACSPQHRHRAEAELRTVYVMFVMPLITAKVTGNYGEDAKLFKLLNDMMNLVTSILDRFKGHLRQFIVDDKGVILIATFGLRGSTFPNMVTERALPATLIVHDALQNELGVDNQIGGTIGKAYCGVVGGIRRHEFAVLGPSVNLSARLMASPHNPGILVDDAVRMKGGKVFSFDALPPVKAKGYSELVSIFEPISAMQRRWGKVKPNFVGRKEEIDHLCYSAKAILSRTRSPPKLLFLTASSGTGKSAFIVQTIALIRKTFVKSRKRVVITRNISNEGDSLVPFSLFRSIFLDILCEVQVTKDDASNHSASRSDFNPRKSLSSVEGEMDALSEYSGSASQKSHSKLMDSLAFISNELNAPSSFAEIVGSHLLGFNSKEPQKAGTKRSLNAFALQAILEFMAKAFVRCTQHADLTILALDDVHYMDSMSWKVVQAIFETGSNLLILCASRPLDTFKITIDPHFWSDLRGKYKKQDQFEEIELKIMCIEDITQLTSKTLGYEPQVLDPTFVREIHQQSGGMPDFACQLLENVKRQGLVEKLSSGKIGWKQAFMRNGQKPDPSIVFANIGDLLLQRIDSLDDSVRKTLHLAAIFGTDFDLRDMITGFEHLLAIKDADKAEHGKKVMMALDAAVQDGILEEIFVDVETNGHALNGSYRSFLALQECRVTDWNRLLANELRSFRFSHDMWRVSILKPLLDARKRDMFRCAALAYEEKVDLQLREDYRSMVKLFVYWKESGDSHRAASVALEIGTRFEQLGTVNQCIKVYDDAFSMWRTQANESKNEYIAGFNKHMLNTIGITDLEYLIKLHIALGKGLASLHRGKESVKAYQNGLLILQNTAAAKGIEDRSIIFPLYSGLFDALRLGEIEHYNGCSYEQALAKAFLDETRLQGDLVHYSRALAMQGETYAQQGFWEKALEVHHAMAGVYEVSAHSTEICSVYGSDRCAQSFAQSSLWHMQMGNVDKALDTCRYVIEELLPQMDLRNVHNSGCLLFPVILIMNDNGMASKANELFYKYVVQQFNAYYVDEAFTFFLPLYSPILIWLDLSGTIDTEVEQLGTLVDWALDIENLKFNKSIDIAMGHLGRTCHTITAEICLLLAERTNDEDTKCRLVKNGLEIASLTVNLTKSKEGTSGMIIAYSQIKPIYDQLIELTAYNSNML